MFEANLPFFFFPEMRILASMFLEGRNGFNLERNQSNGMSKRMEKGRDQEDKNELFLGYDEEIL